MFAKMFCKSVIAMCLVLAESAGIAASSDEIAVRAIPQQIVDGWNRGDGKAVAAVYADEGVLVAGHGVVKRGRSQIASYHEDLFATTNKGTELVVQIIDVRLLNERTAIIQTEGGILWPGEATVAPRNRGIQSFVAVKSQAGWHVVLFQNTRISASN